MWDVLAQTPTAVSARVSERAIALTYMVIGSVLVYLVMFDHGAALALFLNSSSPDYVHELFHDSRHITAAPCH